MKTYKFLKTGSEWYVDLPEYIEQGGSQGDLQMVEGADKMLDMMAGNEDVVFLCISKEPFAGADVLTLIEKCDPYIGGGYYFMKNYQEQEVDRTMWLCQVTAFALGDIPEQIFVRKETTNIKTQ
jgi:hypothetical protein